MLTAYGEAGGDVQMELFEGSGHGPHIDNLDGFADVFFGLVERA